MKKQKDEKRLEDLISRSINTEKPQFDAEKWKQKYLDEYQTLLSRAAKEDSSRRPKILKVILKSPLVKMAVAAVIILGMSFFIHQIPDEQKQHKLAEVEKSPVEMMTTISLERAFQRGGIEAVENQCEQALKLLGTRTASLSSYELLSEFNGS
jgi:hypothetical protein